METLRNEKKSVSLDLRATEQDVEALHSPARPRPRRESPLRAARSRREHCLPLCRAVALSLTGWTGRLSQCLCLKKPIFYFIMTSKSKSSDFVDLHMPERSHQVLL